MPVSVKRAHRGDSSDSEAVNCSACSGTGKNQYGNPCPICLGPGWILQQRVDANGRAIRVNLDESTWVPPVGSVKVAL